MATVLTGSPSKKKILCVGLACIDIVNVCDQYPEEDSKYSCIEQKVRRGGNASNMCTVLALLGARCEYLGTLSAKSPFLTCLLDDLARHGIDASNCILHSNKDDSFVDVIAIVTLSQQTGSRTITTVKKTLPELTFEEFRHVFSKETYQWIHFEGRKNVADIYKMLEYIRAYNSTAPEEDRILTSVEIERVERKQDNIECFLNKSDYIFVGKDYARLYGWDNKEKAVEMFAGKCPSGTVVICAWGEDGAAATIACGGGPQRLEQTISVVAHKPAEIVDTTAAGDTFMAAVILAMCHHRGNHGALAQALEFGCRVAGAKCGLMGMKGLREACGAFTLNGAQDG